MKTAWDYTDLAEAYLKRPDYATDAIEAMLEKTTLSPMPVITEDGVVCDVGAGVAHLTLMLAAKGYIVHAIEPNDAMRERGIKRTAQYNNVTWYNGVGEDTGMEESTYNLVTFGSSFNVCDRTVALAEANRILKPQGWFACMWNWRSLDDNLQMQIEDIITSFVPEYDYGTRREDQTDIINNSKLFGPVERISGSVVHSVASADFIEGWRSHGTLHRQSGSNFDTIIKEIGKAVNAMQNNGFVEVPYTTNIWMAQKIAL